MKNIKTTAGGIMTALAGVIYLIAKIFDLDVPEIATYSAALAALGIGTIGVGMQDAPKAEKKEESKPDTKPEEKEKTKDVN